MVAHSHIYFRSFPLTITIPTMDNTSQNSYCEGEGGGMTQHVHFSCFLPTQPFEMPQESPLTLSAGRFEHSKGTVLLLRDVLTPAVQGVAGLGTYPSLTFQIPQALHHKTLHPKTSKPNPKPQTPNTVSPKPETTSPRPLTLDIPIYPHITFIHLS